MFRVHPVLLSVLLLGQMSVLSGCATILGGGGKEPVRVTSTPSGRHVEIVDKRGTVIHNAVTPFTVTLDRGAGFFSPAEYSIRTVDAKRGSSQQGRLNPGLNVWYVGNVVFGGLIGLVIVDPLTGAMWDLPDQFNLDGEIKSMLIDFPPDPSFDAPPGSEPTQRPLAPPRGKHNE